MLRYLPWFLMAAGVVWFADANMMSFENWDQMRFIRGFYGGPILMAFGLLMRISLIRGED